MDDDSLMRLLVDERTRQIDQNYHAQVLRKYHFAVDSVNAARAMAIFRSEAPDSILESLRPDGTRAGLGVRPPVGIIASADGVGVTIADIIHRARPATNQSGRVRVRGAAEVGIMAARVVYHELIVRDARDRGLDKEPELARRLRLAADEIATKAMVERARPADPRPEVLRAYTEKNAGRYRTPARRVARVAMFSDADSARAALRAWNGIGFPPDSALTSSGFRLRERVRPGSLFPRQVATLSIPEASARMMVFYCMVSSYSSILLHEPVI